MGVDFHVYIPDDKKDSRMSYTTFGDMRVMIATKYLESKNVKDASKCLETFYNYDEEIRENFNNPDRVSHFQDLQYNSYEEILDKLDALAGDDRVAEGLYVLLNKCDCDDFYSTYECEIILRALEKAKALLEPAEGRGKLVLEACERFMETLRYAVENDGYVIAN